MSGLWGWWRREREETPSKSCEAEPEKDSEVKEDDEDQELPDTDDEESESHDGEETVIDLRDVGVPDDSPTSTEEPSAISDYDEVKDISETGEQMEPIADASEESKPDVTEEHTSEVVEEQNTEDREWSDEDCVDWDIAMVPTVTLTLNLKQDEGVCSIEEIVTPLYEPQPSLYSADAKLAPVYSTVNKPPHKEEETAADALPLSEPEEDVYQELPDMEEPPRTPTPVPPPIPLPDWDDLRRDVVWRFGKIKRVKKWIGGSKVNNIPNRLSKMLSQDYLCHQVFFHHSGLL